MKLIRAFMLFLLRAIFGVAALVCIGEFLGFIGVSTIVGVNPSSVCMVGVLGISGIGVMYGIVLLHNL